MTPDVRHYTLLFRRERPDRPLLDCYWSARRHVHFLARLRADVAEHKRRSKAARKGWKTRRAQA